MGKKKFTWNEWDYDCDGEAYIIAKSECPNKSDVPDYICRVDRISDECKPDMNVKEGWCRWEVRTDWDNGNGEPQGWYCIYRSPVKRAFPVRIVRKEEWY